ncbi:type IV secretory system conjugative DNA transfer family protein [Enterococcus gallinarum]|uniref:type IV secretory system conjugative DNA transfer family protein n=1 Tax=Enterococcus gallinarum TaxID=1353 RepID=UPI001E10EA75|nr:helicase HerA-like domain-containing protein [Enterococcus gallinarum]MDT2681207.1 DUF853 family protein [Enterococcus gallinarum]HJE18407.1 DUF853 family protein [Enterococcus casseliflavus]
MQENNFFNGLFQPKKRKGTNLPPQRTRYQQLLVGFCFVGVMLYPFSFAGVIPLLVVQLIDKKDQAAHVYDRNYESFLKRGSSLFLVVSFVISIVNLCCFIFWIPRGYFSAYLFFPLNLLETSLTFNWQTVIALVLGGCGMGSIFLSFSAFIAKRKVLSKEEEQKHILASKAYKERRKDKFNESQRFTEEYEQDYEQAIKEADVVRYEALKQQFLLGTSEYGLPCILNFKEFNQHAIVAGTTGSGKTTFLQLFIQHAAKFDIPLILIDGKGAQDTYEAMKKVAEKYNKRVKKFTDEGDMRYNPVANGNAISVRDKLVTLAETESVFYSGAAKSLLQATVQLLDAFKGTSINKRDKNGREVEKKIERSLPFIQHYLLPRNVLDLFADAILPNNPKLFEIEVEKKIERTKKKSAQRGTEMFDHSGVQTENEKQEEAKKSQLKDSKFRNIFQQGDTQPEAETIVLDRETLDLDSYYLILKKSLKYLSPNAKTGENVQRNLFEQLFVRYEHKQSPFYLYATSEALQNNINMLLDSELGQLFDTSEHQNILSFQQIVRQKDIVYVSLNGLIYKEYIRTLAQMLVGDINYYLSEMYQMNHQKELIVLFDEPSSYLNETFIDLVNKGRGAGMHAIFSPQTMADIAKLGDKLQEQLVGNVNTLIIGKTNEPGEAEYWSNMIGTYEDIELTTMTEQEEGYSDVGKIDWAGQRGTKRNVNKFKISPDRIKELRKGEFIVHRTATDEDIPPQMVYVRNVLEWLEKNK